MKIQWLTVILSMIFTGIALPVNGQIDEDNNEKTLSKMENVVVTATKTQHRLEDVPVETVLITRQEIEQSNSKSVSALLNQIPGFNFSQQSDMASTMGYKNTVRGLNVESRYLLVLVDGQRVFPGYHSGGMAAAGFSHNVNVVPVELIERIEVVKGSGSALYGSDAVVGVLNIITRRPSREMQAAVGGGYSTYDAKGNDFMGSTPKTKSRNRHNAFAVVGGPISDKVKGILSFSNEGNEGIHPTDYDVYRNYVHGRMEIEATDDLRLQAGAEYTVWEEQEDTIGDDKKETTPRFYASADYRIAPLHNLKFQAYYQNLDADFDDPLFGIQKADVSYSDAELQYTGSFFSNHLLSAGLEYLKESLDTNRVTDKEIITSSVYLQDELTFMDDRLVLVPGVRFDDNDVYGQKWNPKFSAMYKIAPESTLRASVGRSFKAPSAIQSSGDPINHVVQWVFSNPDLKPETSVTWQVGLEQGFFDRRLALSATYYYMDVQDMINYASRGETYLGIPTMTYENLEEARIQGVEATADFSIMEGFDLHLNYAYTDAKNKETDERLIDTPKHSFGAVLDYTNKPHRFGGAMSLTYTSDQRNLVFAPGASEQTEAFTSIGFNAWKTLFKNTRLKLEVDNLLDEDLEGSDTIYVGRSIMAKLDFQF